MSVVIGSGPAAIRAAAVTGSLLLDTGEPGADEHPSLPEGLGHVPSTHRALLARYCGAAPPVSAEGLSRGLATGGRVHRLPLGPAEVLELFDIQALPSTVQDWARARTRRVVKRLVGGGLEERTYEDWIIQRFGDAAFHNLFQSYAERRWGEPTRLSVSAARLFHGRVLPEEAVAPGASPAAGRAALDAAVPERRYAAVRGLRLEEGAVVAVETDGGEVPVQGTLYCAVPPPRVVAWLGDAADGGLRFDASELTARPRIQVALQVGPVDLPAATHIAGPHSAPFFLLTRPGLLPGCEALRDTVIAHLSPPPDHPLATADDETLAQAVAMAFPDAVGGAAPTHRGARIQRLPDHDPDWLAGPWHPAQNRVMLALADRGIQLVGPAGTHRYIDPGQELAFLHGLVGGEVSPHELQRTLLDPPVLLVDDAPSIGRFVQR